MGKKILKLGFRVGGSSIVNRTIEVYETKTLYKVEVWNSSFIGWKTNHKPIAKVRYKKTEYPNPKELPAIKTFKEKVGEPSTEQEY